MTSYGVIPEGFSRKPLPAILAEIEAAMINTFGPGVIQSPQSPLGQLNGLQADLIAQLWEFGESVYQSFDADQAEGARLEMLAKLRLLARGSGEDDIDFRQAITNAGRARIDLQDLSRAIRGLAGVTYSQVFVNDGDDQDENGIAGHSVAVAVLGGNDTEIARAVRDYVVPGIGTHGNTRVDVNIEGYCRTIRLLRPTLRDTVLQVRVTLNPDANGCPSPSPEALEAMLFQELTGDFRPINGQDITLHTVRVPMARRHPNVVINSARYKGSDNLFHDLPLAIPFDQIAHFSSVSSIDVVVD